MKNAIPPTLPRISRSARKAEDRDAFDDNVDVRAPSARILSRHAHPSWPLSWSLSFRISQRIQASTCPPFSFSQHYPDDDQDQPTKKKRRTSIKKGPKPPTMPIPTTISTRSSRRIATSTSMSATTRLQLHQPGHQH
ncbi:hypothetical protein MHU86_17585 [Fragilaria crotonensis]|nr:hypothetical protein MHU86_17585 [Fragilaria crotonensis]